MSHQRTKKVLIQNFGWYNWRHSVARSKLFKQTRLLYKNWNKRVNQPFKTPPRLHKQANELLKTNTTRCKRCRFVSPLKNDKLATLSRQYGGTARDSNCQAHDTKRRRKNTWKQTRNTGKINKMVDELCICMCIRKCIDVWLWWASNGCLSNKLKLLDQSLNVPENGWCRRRDRKWQDNLDAHHVGWLKRMKEQNVLKPFAHQWGSNG